MNRADNLIGSRHYHVFPNLQINQSIQILSKSAKRNFYTIYLLPTHDRILHRLSQQRVMLQKELVPGSQKFPTSVIGSCPPASAKVLLFKEVKAQERLCYPVT